jgi:hypothetical protein
MLGQLSIKLLRRIERKQRAKMQEYKGTVKTLEEQAIEEKKKDKANSTDMKDFIGSIQQIVNTVLWLVENSGKDVGGWTTSDLMLLMNKFNECSGRKDDK